MLIDKFFDTDSVIHYTKVLCVKLSQNELHIADSRWLMSSVLMDSML